MVSNYKYLYSFKNDRNTLSKTNIAYLTLLLEMTALRSLGSSHLRGLHLLHLVKQLTLSFVLKEDWDREDHPRSGKRPNDGT